jgi:hypothetical protein
VPRQMAEEAGLFEIDERQQEREREILAQRATSAFTGRVAIVDEIAAFMDADSAEDAGRFDEALSGCQFESAEMIAKRDHDGRRYNVIAIDPSEEQTAAGRAQIAAYAVIEHINEMMHDVALGPKRYIEIIRECKHWMRAIEEERDGMEPQTRAAVWTVLVRARAAANAARNQHPQSLEAATARRAAELAALAARTH